MIGLQIQEEIQQLLRKEKNITVLEAIRMLLRRKEAQEDDLSDEEVAELEGCFQDIVSRKVKTIGEKESIRMIRAASEAKG